MNILIFSAIYPAPREYGIPNDTKVVHYYAKQWKAAGHNVQVVFLHMIPAKKIVRVKNLRKCFGFESKYEIDDISVNLFEYQLVVPKRNRLSKFQAKNADKRMTRLLKQLDAPDKVFVHFPCSFKGIKSAFSFDCPTMAVLHNIDVRLLKKNPNLHNELLQYTNIGGRNKRICDESLKLLSRKSEMVLSGIDENLIAKPEIIEEKISREWKSIKILYAGNLIKLKNVDTIIKALKQTEIDYQLEIIGNGPEMKKLMLLAAQNPRIIFRGRMSREATIEKMREADIFVMVSSPETFGLVYLEAMAQGCITIGSKNEGIDGVIVDGENGFLVNPGCVDSLSQCIKKIADMKIEQRTKIIQSAYHDASQMTDYEMSMKYFQFNN